MVTPGYSQPPIYPHIEHEMICLICHQFSTLLDINKLESRIISTYLSCLVENLRKHIGTYLRIQLLPKDSCNTCLQNCCEGTLQLYLNIKINLTLITSAGGAIVSYLDTWKNICASVVDRSLKWQTLYDQSHKGLVFKIKSILVYYN
jgi:hypothetical protein